MTSIVQPPISEYASRQTAREASAAARERTHVHLGNGKVTVFIAGVIYGAYAVGNDPSAAIFGAGTALFIALSVWHQMVLRALARAQAAVEQTCL